MLNELTPRQWQQVYDMRTERLAQGLSTAPANRPAAEAAVIEMYQLIGKAAPQFLWVDSPMTANMAIWLFNDKDRASLGASLWASLGDSLWASLGDSLWDSLRASLRASLGDSLWDSLWASLGASLWASLGDSLWASLGDSLRASLGDSLGASLGDSLWDSLWASLGDSLWDSLRDSLGASLGDSQLRLNNNCFWGNQDVYWIAFYQIPERLGFVTYEPETSRRLEMWATIARSCGWWWPFDQVCIMSERPAEIHVEPWADRDNSVVRLHNAHGPSLRYHDGWTVYSWHGLRVPADLIDQGWDLTRILSERNQEVRRAAVERAGGWPTFRDDLTQVGKTVPDPGNPGAQLALYDIPDQVYTEPVRVLICTNGSVEKTGERRQYGLTTPAQFSDPVAAAAWTYGLTRAQYAECVRRT
jgi:hypothetical protein